MNNAQGEKKYNTVLDYQTDIWVISMVPLKLSLQSIHLEFFVSAIQKYIWKNKQPDRGRSGA